MHATMSVATHDDVSFSAPQLMTEPSPAVSCPLRLRRVTKDTGTRLPVATPVA